MKDTRSEAYAERLKSRSGARWKRILDVQAPYRWHLRRQRLGRTLDIGCGIGRNLVTLDPGSVGVDHNEASVAEARRRGLDAMTTQEWERSDRRVPESFDSLLLSHVVEHMDEATAKKLMADYLPYLKPGGSVLFVCPQERGYASDETHVWFVDGDALEQLSRDVGLVPSRAISFPFPRIVGRVFTHNEFRVLATKPKA